MPIFTISGYEDRNRISRIGYARISSGGTKLISDSVKHYLPPRRTMQCPPEKRRPTLCGKWRLAVASSNSNVLTESPKGLLWRSSGKEDEYFLEERNRGQFSFNPADRYRYPDKYRA